MTTAPTGQAVFDPFAPLASTLPQSVAADPVVSSPVSATQAVNLPDNSDNKNSSTQINVTPPVQVATTQVNPTVAPTENSDDASLHDTQDSDQINQEQEDVTVDSPGQTVLQQVQINANQTLDVAGEQDFDLTEDEWLALLDQVLTETEQASSVFDQVMPAAIIATDPLNPQGAVSSSARKPETVASNSAPQEAGLIGQVEYEPSSELPVEVEGFLERVEDHADKLPQEIVIADEHAQLLPQSHPTQTVIMLPITEQDEENPVKDVKLSLTWLLEWSHKIIKKFVGKVVYRHESNS
ncbi:MAG TPA: hypothetical protein PKJ26_03770 [Candidatus Woesebacteria bacterium]|nr:hypothetical protein [Candidatus Woesebacteria bacterium]HNS65587.1 hypothetical protein [Candidatus Woesebacteria bacterium]